MRRIALVRPAVCSVLILAVGLAPWNIAMAAPASKPTPKAAPTTTAETPPATAETPPGETPPGETPPGETPPGETPPGETPPGETPPGETPPGETPPGETPPDVETPPEPEAKVEPPPPEPPPPDPMADRPPEPQLGGKSRKGVGMMIAGGTVFGVGLAATITFGLVTRHCKYSGPLQCKYQDQDQFLIPMGAAVTLLGAMLLGVGAGYYVGYKKWERWTPAVAAAEKAKAEKRKGRGRSKNKTAFAPAMIPGGGAMVVGGRF